MDVCNYPAFSVLCLSIFNECYDEETLDIMIVFDTIADTFIYLRKWYNPEKNKNPYYFIKYNLLNRYNKKIASDENYYKNHEKIEKVLFYEDDDDIEFLVDDILDVAKTLDDNVNNNVVCVTYEDIISDRIMGFTIQEISERHSVAPSLVHKKLTRIKNKCIEVGLFSD